MLGDRRSTKIAKMMVLCWRLIFLRQGQIFFPMHLYRPGTYIGKMLIIHILDISSIIQLNRNLMMSIRALMRHKIAKWADRKSKMAITAAILKINFRHLFSNLRSLWAETCSLATGWLLDRNKPNLCQSKIQDGRNGSAPLNKMAARVKNWKRQTRPWLMAWFQNICTEVFHQWSSTKITKMAPLCWTKWRPELNIEKPLKDISSQPVSWFQSYFTEMFLVSPFTKNAKKVLLGWTKWPPELKIEKTTTLNISSLASGLILEWFHRNVPLIPLYQNCQNGFALLVKMVTRAKNRKAFKRHLRGQWQDFKIISHQCSYYVPLPKLLKSFCSAEQNGCQS